MAPQAAATKVNRMCQYEAFGVFFFASCQDYLYL